MEAGERLIVALDVKRREQVQNLVEELQGYAGIFKVGLELFCHLGPPVVSMIREQGARVFLDLKLHDIPRTAAQAARAAVRMGASMFTVHVAGGRDMLRSVAEAVHEEAGTGGPPKVLGVTVLTSLGAEQLKDELGLTRSPLDQVLFWAELARSCGLSGVVASPREVEAIRTRCGRDFLIVTPGIRLAGSGADDQKRVSTPAQALRSGADYLVVGRPILQAENPRRAAAALIQEMEGALECQNKNC